MPRAAPPEPGRRRAAVALGANLGDRRGTLEAALGFLAREAGPVLAASSFHETEALIHPDDPALSHPAYLNAAAVIGTALGPFELLDRLQGIERALGRDRAAEAARWRPRLVDLDLLALEGLELASDRLVLPHPEMHRRAFVLAPLAEVWPGWRHPRLGRTVAELLADLALTPP